MNKDHQKIQSAGRPGRVEPEPISIDWQSRKLLDSARQAAASESSITLTGESGTGKEVLARYIHKCSRRQPGPFLTIKCGAFTGELLGKELFGREVTSNESSTNPVTRGAIENANGGTLYLDEVAEIPIPLQVKLLRVIQDKELVRIGGTIPIEVDVRFLAASNRDLQDEMANGRFRQDLYYRLNVVTLQIPPLAERKNDIPLLIQHFIQKYGGMMKKKVEKVSTEVAEILQQYNFPGNVRELENIIERGITLASGNLIETDHLPEELQKAISPIFFRKNGVIPTLAEQEGAYIEWVMKETGNNKTEAAKILGIDRVSLWRKLKKMGLE